MADRVQILMHETEQKAMLEKEDDIARSIQTTLLPPCGFAKCGPLELNGFFQPASECGGDFWCYNRLPDGSVLLTIGDVTGHGVPSAMITACAKSALDTLLSMSSMQQFSLSQIVASLNVAICQTAKRTLFMTFQAIRISSDGHMAEIVNAGHNFPLLVRLGSAIILRLAMNRSTSTSCKAICSCSIPMASPNTSTPQAQNTAKNASEKSLLRSANATSTRQ